MLTLKPELEVYLYGGASDMRHGIDRLAEKIREELKRAPVSGGVFVFLSRCRRKMRLLYWDRDGYCMWLKRLEAGVFKVDQRDGYEEITGVDLDELLKGVELARIKVRKNAEKGLYA